MILSQVLELIPEEIFNSIKDSIINILDEKIKNRYYINKHFQNAIMNYFLEDYGSYYLREQFDKQSNREVRRYLTTLSTTHGYKGTKYMIMMNIYLDVHNDFNLMNEYRQILKSVALQENSFDPDSQEYISLAWKKAFGLFVLAHTFDKNLNSIFDIWNSLFLDQKIFRKRKPNSKTNSSEQQQRAYKKNNKNNESEIHEDSSLSQTDKDNSQKSNVKQEYSDTTFLTCATVSNFIQNNTIKINSPNNSQTEQRLIFENQRNNTISDQISDCVSNASNNIANFTNLMPQNNNQNYLQINNLQYPSLFSPSQTQSLLFQGQNLLNQVNSGQIYEISTFPEQSYFVNPQQQLLNPQSFLIQQQQQQFFLQKQQLLLLEQQKYQFNLMMASQLSLPQIQTVGSM